MLSVVKAETSYERFNAGSFVGELSRHEPRLTYERRNGKEQARRHAKEWKTWEPLLR